MGWDGMGQLSDRVMVMNEYEKDNRMAMEWDVQQRWRVYRV